MRTITEFKNKKKNFKKLENYAGSKPTYSAAVRLIFFYFSNSKLAHLLSTLFITPARQHIT